MSVTFRTALMAVIIVLLLLILLAATYYLYWMNKSLSRAEKMLEDAVNGNFREHSFDETRLSRLESRMYHFIGSAALNKQRLEEEREKLKELIGDISHQTKTPLANIRLYSQLLLEQELSEKAAGLALQVETQSRKLDFLVANLVKLSRLESNFFTFYPEKLEASKLLMELKNSYSPQAEEKEVALILKPFPEEAAVVYCDRKWTLEALGNLVDNAVKYTPSGGTVTLSMKCSPMFTTIIIEDTGIGICEDEQPKIFGRFYRSPKVRNQEGVGIGLYLTRQLLAGQNALLKMTSVEEKGTCFQVSFATLDSNLTKL